MADKTGADIVAWVRGKLGTRVTTRGECWDLAEEALKANGFTSSRDLGPSGPDDDYVWGTPVELKDVQPGDILQMRDYSHTTTWDETGHFPDGADAGGDNGHDTFAQAHHTSVVTATATGDVAIAVLHQNVDPGGKKVQSGVIHAADVAEVTTVRTERRENPETKRMDTATITRKTTITMKGTIKAYRPILKPPPPPKP